ncbi:M66 family metalloprotease [Undibacterium sp. Dicai25W]|uniref:M66 family metalloprotease n=1 Tax=Undibacterium sp. Dicai25W TaxID=3413034 RepID=UPI003BF0E282
MDNRKSKLKSASTGLFSTFVIASSLLSGCGGGSGSSGIGTNTNASSPNDTNQVSPPSTVQPPTTHHPELPAISVTKIEVAQTHVLPPNGLSWPTTTGSAPLILAGQRDALALIQFTQADVKNPVLEIWNNQTLIQSISLNSPDKLPATEGGEAAYGNNIWSAKIPAALVTPGMLVNFSSDNYGRTTQTAVTVGANIDLTMQILPFVLFGATNANTGLDLNTERIMRMTDQMKQQITAGWPGNATVVNHPAGQFVSPYFVMPPQNGAPAYLASSMSDINDGGLFVDAINDLTYQVHQASGDMSINRVTFSSVIAVDNTKPGTNKLAWIGNGVSIPSAGVATGGNSYGFLLHETGHAMSLNHSRSEYNDPTGKHYPYIQGSLAGSAWGYNSATNEFRHPLVPKTSPIFQSCTKQSNYQLDANGRCYRLDPMDHADDGSDPKYNGFSLFSDYNIARIQRWITGQIKLDGTSPTNFSKWDNVSSSWKPYTPVTTNSGVDQIKGNVPVLRNIPVAKIVLTLSNAGTPNVSRFYPPILATDSSIETIDPTDVTQLAKIYPYTLNGNNAEYMWYCHQSGCDYTLRVTFSDGSQAYRLLKGGFRKYSNPATFDAGVTDPTNSKSFHLWAINVPNPSNAKVAKLELLDTSMIWNMTPTQIKAANVLMSQSF